jgi:hypothetical protein
MLRQLALAAQAEVLIGFELGHTEEIVQDVKPVALGELAQLSHLIGDERDRLLRTAFARFLSRRTSPSSRPRPFPDWFRHQTPSESLPGEDPTLRQSATPRWYFATFRI